MGLINRVFADDQFQTGLISLFEELLGKSGAVLRLTVKALRDLSLRDFDQALRYTENIYCSQLLKTADVAEGVAAFLEKRSPSWRHS
jgi:2-(1,2-epoxy-1,2-dihydrophenyl)acetyl-CoA isomerase